MSGPMTDPCGNPKDIFFNWDLLVLTNTFCLLCYILLLNQSKMLPQTPYAICLSRCRDIKYQMLFRVEEKANHNIS